MFRKYLSFTFACALLVFSASVFVSAQTGQLRGVVVMKQADGTLTPGNRSRSCRIPNRHQR